MHNRVTFWTEGGGAFGMGHVVRCLSLAKALRAMGREVSFLVNDSTPVKLLLNDAGFEYSVNPLEVGYGSVCEPACNGHAAEGDVVVLDTRKDVSDMVGALKAAGKTVVLIDNLSATVEADAVVVPSATFSDWDLPGNIYAGEEYLIIGESFLKTVRRKKDRRGPLKLLVTFGGSDPFHLTDIAVEELKSLVSECGPDELDVTVVLGPASKPTRRLKAYLSEPSGGISFLCGVKDMAPVMAASDLAVTAVGISVYELAYMGVPSILLGNYASDATDLERLEGLGIAKRLDYFMALKGGEIKGAVQYLMRDPKELKRLSERARTLTDGRGAGRIARIIADFFENAGPARARSKEGRGTECIAG